MKTFFASPDRSDKAEVEHSHEVYNAFAEEQYMIKLIPDMLLVLNENRQIIYANKMMLEYLKVNDVREILGRRQGEVLHCTNAEKMEAGCGTALNCAYCGALKAVQNSANGKTAKEECRILTNANDALDLTINATTTIVKNDTFIVVIIKDISAEKRKKALERIFFHDIINTAGGINGLSDLVARLSDEEASEYGKLLYKISSHLVEEIVEQRDLISAENNELLVRNLLINPREQIASVIALYSEHIVASQKTIVLNETTSEHLLETDPVLVRRILGNLLKNALEATGKGGTVTLSGKKFRNYYIFSVHNDRYIEPAIQAQIFNRSFSTKGADRGLGTYSIKLLTEKYLKGRAGFFSDKLHGTDFYFILRDTPETNPAKVE
ncbi:MAG: GHKL domain-containing protein [Ignavibacteriales bacterium]|nr:GHKL domain-containing protein [Ignavibacteriales bacterium]